MNKLRRIFNPTVDEQIEDLKFLYEHHKKLTKDRGCSTCKHLKHVKEYPAFVMAEGCVCNAGLTCDSVFYSIKDCPKWEDSFTDKCLHEQIESIKLASEATGSN